MEREESVDVTSEEAMSTGSLSPGIEDKLILAAQAGYISD